MNEKRGISIMLALAVLWLLGLPVLAQSGGGYDLSWWTTDGGGGQVAAGGYVLDGSIGQPDAASALLSGGGYTLTGGLWADGGGGPTQPKVYMPIMLK